MKRIGWLFCAVALLAANVVYVISLTSILTPMVAMSTCWLKVASSISRLPRAIPPV